MRLLGRRRRVEQRRQASGEDQECDQRALAGDAAGRAVRATPAPMTEGGVGISGRRAEVPSCSRASRSASRPPRGAPGPRCLRALDLAGAPATATARRRRRGPRLRASPVSRAMRSASTPGVMTAKDEGERRGGAAGGEVSTERSGERHQEDHDQGDQAAAATGSSSATAVPRPRAGPTDHRQEDERAEPAGEWPAEVGEHQRGECAERGEERRRVVAGRHEHGEHARDHHAGARRFAQVDPVGIAEVTGEAPHRRIVPIP